MSRNLARRLREFADQVEEMSAEGVALVIYRDIEMVVAIPDGLSGAPQDIVRNAALLLAQDGARDIFTELTKLHFIGPSVAGKKP